MYVTSCATSNSNVVTYCRFSTSVMLIIRENVWKYPLLSSITAVFILWEHAEVGAEEGVLGVGALDGG